MFQAQRPFELFSKVAAHTLSLDKTGYGSKRHLGKEAAPGDTQAKQGDTQASAMRAAPRAGDTQATRKRHASDAQATRGNMQATRGDSHATRERHACAAKVTLWGLKSDALGPQSSTFHPVTRGDTTRHASGTGRHASDTVRHTSVTGRHASDMQATRKRHASDIEQS